MADKLAPAHSRPAVSSSALGVSGLPIKTCIDIVEHAFMYQYIRHVYSVDDCQSITCECTSRNPPAQQVALLYGATSLHVYASLAPRRVLCPSALESPPCRGTLHISAAQKCRFCSCISKVNDWRTRERTYEASVRTLPSRSSMVAETRALRPLASKRWILITMNYIGSIRVRESGKR
jgi:hypothetical protein